MILAAGGDILKVLKLLFVLNLALVFTSTAFAGGANLPPPLMPVPTPGVGADPYLPKAWHLNKIRAFEAWKISKGNPSRFLAIIDSGINYNHPDLAANIRRKQSEFPMNGQDKDGNGFKDDVIGWDFVRSNALPYDRSGHGTFLAGLGVALEGNGTGSVGVCPQCQVMPVRFLNGDGMGDTEDAVKGLHYAIAEGASVINLSFAGEGGDKDLKDALAEAERHDVVVVVSAGNDGENIDRTSVYPAKYLFSNLITVAATDHQDRLTEGSNWSKVYTQLGAPGTDLVGPWFNEWADDGEGTSDAAILVSAAATLLRSTVHELSAAQTKDILLATAAHSPALKGKVASEGVLDLASAIECAVDRLHPCLKK